MTTIYVRIPRNRWTPIGEIDLSGWHQAYHHWKSPLALNPEIEQRMRKATALTMKIRDYQKQHYVTTRHAERLAQNRHHVKMINQLRQQRWEQGAYRYLRDEFGPERMKANQKRKRMEANDRALASLYEKLTGNRLGWAWQPQETKEKFLKLPLREAEEMMKRELQAKKRKA